MGIVEESRYEPLLVEIKAPLLTPSRHSPKVADTFGKIIKVSEGVASSTALQNGT